MYKIAAHAAVWSERAHGMRVDVTILRFYKTTYNEWVRRIHRITLDFPQELTVYVRGQWGMMFSPCLSHANISRPMWMSCTGLGEQVHCSANMDLRASPFQCKNGTVIRMESPLHWCCCVGIKWLQVVFSSLQGDHLSGNLEVRDCNSCQGFY